MNYYDIALPVRISRSFTYRTAEDISHGCRVLVTLGSTFHTGIVIEKNEHIDPELKYKDILDVIDEKPKISENLLNLAKWISNYYQCSLGLTLSAMLPSAFNIQIQRQVRKISDEHSNENDQTPEIILKKINSINWEDIPKLKNKLELKTSLFNFWLEKLENSGIIEIKRTYDEKIKKKIANFIILNPLDKLPELTPKQTEAFKKLQEKGNDIALSEIVNDVSRSVLKAIENKGLLRIEPREVQTKNTFLPDKRTFKKIKHTEEQKSVIDEIKPFITRKVFQTFLLFGITGSGKTEVYIQVIKKCRDAEKTALMLVPEISLTPQMVERFFNAFGEDIAILHSHLNDRERWEQWNKINSGESKIVIGARSAIFAPLDNIGIIIVDEEHETSYKQDKTPRYNGRDIAIVRAKMSNAVVILGTATPSLESWQNVQTGKYNLLKLTKRPLSYELPSVRIIDMRKEKDHKQLLSFALKEKIEKKLKAKEQIILFQNRRGHSSFVQCISCGKLFECPNCEISMNFHSRTQQLICHYCGHTIDMPRKCPDCGNYMFNFGAAGTQQIEKQLQIIFPTARILRMDSDSARKKESYESMFQRMRNGNIDILLGTQMIAKGLDFANVTLVGVISADIGLNIPDFRAAERTFQLLTQVAGRSGRGEKAGEVIIQTYNPDHFAITCATKQDFESFAKIELGLRKALKYPPSFRIARFLFSHKDLKYLRTQVFKNNNIIEELKNHFEPKTFKVLGIVQAPLVKIQNSYRFHLIIKADSIKVLSAAVSYLQKNLKLGSTIKQVIDIDPYGLL
ncbi:MAG: primosomal protein N' [Candidatus Cloacimonetes bacterium]|nr:primosomal protein N' [Candidatus Cloacimonadota bacterium]